MTTYHFVGIKGSGMSALAHILHDKGYTVQGSDVEKIFFTQKALEEAGILILPFNANNIQQGMTVIAGNAFGDDHEEIKRANELDVPAICGGMAICATCHIEVLESSELPEMNDDEAYMLESLPHATETSRLSCQLRVTRELDGLVVRLKPEA